MIIRVFRPTIHPGREAEFEAFLRHTAIPLVSRQAVIAPEEEHLLRDTWIGHYEVVPTPDSPTR